MSSSSLCFFAKRKALTRMFTAILDILLHQSGHIMLSDFDLSKQSGEAGGAPAAIRHGGPNGVSA